MAAGNTDGFLTLAVVLAQRAADTPHRQALVFLEDGVHETLSLTYAELHRRAGLIAAALQGRAERGSRALLLFPPGLDFVAAFFGCLYAGMIAVPAYPPRRLRKAARLQSIFDDAQPALILGTGAIVDALWVADSVHPEFTRAVGLATDRLESNGPHVESPVPALENDLAFLQYTSGSTSTPKGVMVTHGNLVANSAYIRRAFALSAQGTRSVSWLPSYHDMGLIDGLLQPIYTGFPGYLLPAAVFFQQPLRWLEAIDRFGATHCGGPDFAYSLCVRATTPEQRKSLDLRRWSSAYNGAEPVRASTLDAFADAFAVSGFRKRAFYPCYGMAETTLMITGAELDAEPVESVLDAGALEAGMASEAAPGARITRLVSSGHLYDEMSIAVVDPASSERCAAGRIGENWVCGPSVAAGYWGRPEQTQETFGARLRPGGEGPYLRTGDLGFLRGGELYVTGRLKDVIILRGLNHYPQDIELTAETSHSGLRRACCAAFTVERDGQEHLVIVQEVERTWIRRLRDSGIIDSLRRAVSLEHGIQPYAVVLLAPGRILKTSSGKIRRQACREAYLSGALEALEISVLSEEKVESEQLAPALLALAPEERRPRLAMYLQEQMGRLLGISPLKVDLRNTALELGLDSLGLLRLRQQLESDLGVTLEAPELFHGTSLDSLLEGMARRLTDPSAVASYGLDGLLESPELGLSRGQRALWFLHRMRPESSAYNVAFAVDIASRIDEAKFVGALESVVRLHPSLRSRIVVVNDEPAQQILEETAMDLEFVEAAGWDDLRLNEEISQACEAPFTLDVAPLWRVRLYRGKAQRCTLLIVVHHIVVDFASMEVLVDDLTSAYAAGHRFKSPRALTSLAVPRTWEESFLSSQEGRTQLAWWVQRLSGSQAALALPYDRRRGETARRRGDSLRIVLDTALARRIRTFARTHSATVYGLLLTGFMAVLRRYSGQGDICIGTSVEGRARAEWANTVGYFANQVVLRCSLDMQASFANWLREVQRECQAAWSRGQIPLATVVEALRPERVNTHSPLFDVMFGLVRASRVPALGSLSAQLPGATAPINGLTLASRALQRRAAQFELMLTVIDADESLVACWEFAADRFDPGTIERFHRSWVELLGAALENPERPVAQLPLLTAEERSRLLISWNETNRASPLGPAGVHELFEAQVRRTPQQWAVRDQSQAV
ncbi:MAG TPA: condensation domain-containing protein, partial [Steroidobacteraceae bacterium]